MAAAFEGKKFAARVGETIMETNKEFREWVDNRAEKAAQQEKERIKTLGFIAGGALPLALGRILVGSAKIGWKGVDKYLLDESWRKGIGAGRKFTEQWAKG